VTEKENAAQEHQAARGELCIPAASGRSPHHRALQSRLVALSRCPDAEEILQAAIHADNGTLVIDG